MVLVIWLDEPDCSVFLIQLLCIAILRNLAQAFHSLRLCKVGQAKKN